MPDEYFAFAKAAWEAGNELAVIDVRIYCAGRCEPPTWLDRSVTDAFSARYRGIKHGPAVSAVQHTQWQMDHLERYAACLVAELRDHVWPAHGEKMRQDSFDGDGIFARAVELLDETHDFGSLAAGIETVRKSYQRVKRDILAGKAAAYWYPSTRELKEHFRQKEGSWLSVIGPMHNGNSWGFIYLRE